MPKRLTRSVDSLPQSDDAWLFAAPQLRTWVAGQDGSPMRPFIAIVISGNTGAIRTMNLYPQEPTVAEVRDLLREGMTHPAKNSGKPGRPQSIAVVDPRLIEPLGAALAEWGMTPEIYATEQPEELDQMLHALEQQMRQEEPDRPGMLSVPGVTPELAGEFFAAAAEYYRAAPWVHLSNYQILAIRHPQEPDFHYAIAMGQGGVEYGLASYRTWEDVERQFHSDQAPEDRIPPDGLRSFFYDDPTMVPFDDLDAIDQYGWEVAGKEAYPVAVVISRDGEPRRPTPREVEWYILALRAIPRLVNEYLKPDGQGDYLPLDVTLRVRGHGGMVDVPVKYEPDRLDLGGQAAQEFESAAEPVFDRRLMEGMMAQAVHDAGKEIEGDPQLLKAQEVMYKAWEEPNPTKRIQLARRALEISPNCADAYALLAEHAAPTVREALTYWEQAVAAGKRALPPQYFTEYVGEFWSLFDTRPYMRALAGLADALWRINRKDEALENYRELLRLNPGDNQGIRYLLLTLLLRMGRDDDARALLKQYDDDWSAV
ncbi:MAG: tetratricopeptide repeat protein, partial [Anaerolineae bacterium]